MIDALRRCRRGAQIFGVVLCLAAVFPSGVRADDAVDRAEQHRVRGKELFRLGLYRDAAAAYRQAYAARPKPRLLIELARCHEWIDTAKDLDRAIYHVEIYLRDAPAGVDRVAAERYVARLQRKRAQGRDGARGRATPFYKKWWFWTAVGVAVTGAAVTTSVIILQPNDPVAGNAAPGIFRLPLTTWR